MRSEVNATKKAIYAAVEDAVGESARSIRDHAMGAVPVGDEAPHIRDHIVAKVDGLSAEVGIYDADFYYGIFLEFGTSSRPAQPFMTPAAETERKQFVNRIKKHVEKKL